MSKRHPIHITEEYVKQIAAKFGARRYQHDTERALREWPCYLSVFLDEMAGFGSCDGGEPWPIRLHAEDIPRFFASALYSDEQAANISTGGGTPPWLQ